VNDRVAVIGALLALAGLVILWEITFSADPRVNPHPFVLRWIEPPWDDWDALSWEQKMRIFRRRLWVHWAFVLLAGGLWVLLFVEGLLAR
jgi:hypothetical protein